MKLAHTLRSPLPHATSSVMSDAIRGTAPTDAMARPVRPSPPYKRPRAKGEGGRKKRETLPAPKTAPTSFSNSDRRRGRVEHPDPTFVQVQSPGPPSGRAGEKSPPGRSRSDAPSPRPHPTSLVEPSNAPGRFPPFGPPNEPRHAPPGSRLRKRCLH